MKNSLYKNIVRVIFIVVAAGVLLGGYVLLDLIMPDISTESPIGDSVNPACLYVQNNLTLVSFDGQEVKRRAGFMAKTAAVNVPGGQHTLVFDYKVGIDGYGTSTANGFKFTTTFESGRYYFVNYKEYIENWNSMIRLYLRPTEEGIYLGPEE